MSLFSLQQIRNYPALFDRSYIFHFRYQANSGMIGVSKTAECHSGIKCASRRNTGGIPESRSGRFSMILLIIIAAVLLLIILLASYCAYRYVFYFHDTRTEEERLAIPEGAQYQKHSENMRRLLRDIAALPYEQVYITSFDGKKLAGRYYHVKDGAPLQIQMHGYKSCSVRDFCGGGLGARRMGMNVLLVDQRAHGESEGKELTFGILERYDCLSWINYASDRFGADTPIFPIGVSMGAATVLMASDLELPENVKGIIVDCPYSSPKEIICMVGGYIHLPVKLIYPFVYIGARIFGHFNLEETSAVQAVANAKVPILLIHGEDDRFVPCEMSRKIYQACKAPVALETFPEAGHAISYLLDGERYYNVVEKFINGCL